MFSRPKNLSHLSGQLYGGNLWEQIKLGPEKWNSLDTIHFRNFDCGPERKEQIFYISVDLAGGAGNDGLLYEVWNINDLSHDKCECWYWSHHHDWCVSLVSCHLRHQTSHLQHLNNVQTRACQALSNVITLTKECCRLGPSVHLRPYHKIKIVN